jgi:23S rRNA (guanosine2251-2'-O)-methyltransferase
MIVVLDNIRSALNVGSIIRTCDALGIQEIYFCGITPEIKSPKVKKTSLGAEKDIKAEYFKNTKEAVLKIKSKKYQIMGLEITINAEDIATVKIDDERTALVVGNEVSGISDEILELCDMIVKIPMKGKKESLNVSVAFGIAAFLLTK